MVFCSAKIIITGIREPGDVDMTVNYALDQINKFTPIPLHATCIRVKTILAKGHLHRLVCPYRACQLGLQHNFKVRWEPEICNAIIAREGNVSIKIFPRTGCVLAFGKCFREMVAFYHHICSLI